MSNTASAGTSVQEYSIRVPKNTRKSYHVMRFNSVLNVDFAQWGQVKMERENNLKHFKFMKEEQPKFGAGSEYGREAREEARRKKFGIITKQYKADDQPWILKVGGKTGKKFKGIREGGVAENTAYYVFTHAADGGIEAYPLNEWYNFQPIQRYKALSAEEAEQEFGRRNRVMNYFSLMLKKRLKNEDDGGEEETEDGKAKKGGRKSKDFKISEMDDWVDSDDENSSSDGEKGEDDGLDEKKDKNKKGKKNQKKEANKKKKGSDESAFEESDDGDEEGRELDYISDSSESESDIEGKAGKEMKGVAEENALRKLLTSDEDSEEEEKKKEEDKGEEKEAKEGDASKEKQNNKKRKRKKKDSDKKGGGGDSSSNSSADSSDSEAEKPKEQPESAIPSPAEKVLPGASSSLPKKPRLELTQAPLSFGGENGITEEGVRRYLMRKPMTVTELLQKFKGRKTGLNSDQLVNVMAQILKRINPIKQTIKDKMYLSIKPQ